MSQRHRRLVVAQTIGDVAGGLAVRERQRRGRVPQSVELDPPNASRHDQSPELALADVVHLQRLSETVFPAPHVTVLFGED